MGEPRARRGKIEKGRGNLIMRSHLGREDLGRRGRPERIENDGCMGSSEMIAA
jgi:hypothetical protein